MPRGKQEQPAADPAEPTPEVAAPTEQFNFGEFAKQLIEAVREHAAGEAATATANQDPSTSATTPPEAVAAAPQAAAAKAEPQLLPQFGGGQVEAADSVPSVSDEGGYVAALPLLTTGAYGPLVGFLAKLLDRAGFANAQHAGKAEPMLDDALMSKVRAFQAQHGIDPSGPQDGAAPLIRKDHEGLVDAKTWQALLGFAHAVETRYPVIDEATQLVTMGGAA